MQDIFLGTLKLNSSKHVLPFVVEPFYETALRSCLINNSYIQ